MSERNDFLRALDPEAGYFTFQTFPESPTSHSVPRMLCGPLPVVESSLDRDNARGAGIFVAANVFPHGGVRRSETLERIRAIWCDWDRPNERLPATWPLEPHIIVQTSPGKFQVYWRCENMSISDHWAIMQKMIDYGHDRNACDVTRVLRVPGFWHWKNADVDAGPKFRSQLVSARTGRVYTRDEIFDAFGVPEPQSQPPAVIPELTESVTHSTDQELILHQICSQAALKTRADRTIGRHAQMYWVGRRMRESGLPNDSALFQRAFQLCEKWFRPTNTSGEIQPFKPTEFRTIADGYAKGGDGKGALASAVDLYRAEKKTVISGKMTERLNATNGEKANFHQVAVLGEEERTQPPVHDYRPNHEKNKPMEPDWETISELMPACVKRLIDAHEQAAHKSQPELALGAALAILSLPVMRRYRTASDAPLALYTLGIADTGEGKEMGRRQIRVCAAAGDHDSRLQGDYASAAAVQWQLQSAPAHLALIDEFGKLIGHTQSAAGAHEAKAMARLTELYNAHGGRQAMTSYSKRGTDADELRQAEFVYAPTVAVYAVSTPQTLFDAVTSAHIADGFLNRFLVFSSRQGAQPMRWRARSLQCPVEISAWMQHVRNRWCIRRNDFSESDDASRPCRAIHIEESPEALKAFQALDRRKTELIRANEGAQRFFVRTVEKARRIAAIVALGENYETQTVDAECSEWACAVAWTCDLELMRVAQDRIADSEQEALVKRVIRLIRKRSVIPHSELVRATWWIKNGQREDILLTLLQSEAIEIREIVTASGRTVREYVAT